jgi:signal transduction histidine kinase/ligand-binding sensor domain-containing protein
MRASFVFALAAAACPPAYALDPGRATSQYVITRWGADDLPGPAIHALVQTPDRYLWLGTNRGLARFDGARFVSFSARNTKGFADGGVVRLALSPAGALYMGTTTGAVMKLEDGVFSPIPIAGGVAVRVLHAARDGSLWVGTPGVAVHRWKDGVAQSMVRELGGEVPASMVEDTSGALWMGTWREGLIRHQDGAFSRHHVLADTVQVLRMDRSGAFWIGTPHGVYRLRGTKLDHYTRRDGLSHENITSIVEDRDGNVWIGTAGGGVNRFHDGRITRLTTREGLADDDVRSLLEDHEGNLWIGTAAGLSVLSNGRFVTYGVLEGLPDPAVPSVAPGADGSVWVGTLSAGVARLRDGALTHYPLPPGIGKDAVLALFEDRTGGLWLSVENGRLFYLKNGVMTDHSLKDVPTTWRVTAISEDEEGPLFFVNGFGQIGRIRNGRLTAIHPGAPRLGYAHFIHRDARGQIWMGLPKGLARVAGPQYTVLTTRDGLPHDRVRALCEEPDGSLWVATAGGLGYLKGEATIHQATVEHGLPENYLRVVLDDGRGHLWMASTGYIFRVAKKELHDLFAGRVSTVKPHLFDVSDGLRTTETLLSNSPGFRGQDGRLWFATARGVSVVDPAQIRTDSPAPAVRIERIDVDGKSGAVADPEYPPGRGAVSVEYTALTFAGRVRFQYRMEGFDDGWIDADERRTAYYSNLPPGRYRFLVRASNRDGVWNAEPAAITFALGPFFYQRTWFYALCLATLIGVAAAAYRLRVAQMRARYAAVAAERERIAREWHDSLAQGIAAVGIQLQAIIDTLGGGHERVKQHAELAWRMVQSSLEQVRGSIWALRSQNLERTGLVAAVQETLKFFTTGTRISGAVVIEGAPYTLHPDVEWNGLRIVQEAITNAVRHSGAARIDVTITYEPQPQRLRLQVRDDGKGFDADGALGTREPHFGLLGMRERAMALGGTLTILGERGRGTTVTAHLPARLRGQAAEAPRREGTHG